jgi:hypothetical protein
MKYVLLGSLCCFFYCCTILSAQTLNNRRFVRMLPTNDSLFIDSLPLAPGSVSIRQANQLLVENIDYKVDYFKSIVYGLKNISDTIEVGYTTIQLPLNQVWQKQPREANSQFELSRASPFRPESQQQSTDDWLGIANLDKNGSISRGLSLGNNQNIVLNAGFNLQLRGQLSDDITLIASVTDDNLPFQPDGYTQQLQDFDRVFIELKNDRHALILGDYDLRRPPAYFLNTFKNVKGVKSDNVLYREKGDTLQQQLNLSAARGQFGRQVFMGREGNQGPYRLQVDNQTGFIVILAGSERVYIDGVLLKRGEQYDYIIDYNTADITFTPQRLITNQSRIIVEFEYANQAYVRSILNYNVSYLRKNHRFHFNTYQEQDAGSQPLFQELDDNQRLFIRDAGDSVGQLFYPAVTETGFLSDRIQYKKVDTLGFSNVYVYSNNPDSAIYSIRFSLVGQGRGDYIQSRSLANGRVYEWIAPIVNGTDTLHRGSYAAVVQLIAPNRQQLTTLGASGNISGFTQYTGELAYSRNDPNRFSDGNISNQQGYAARLKLDHDQPLSSLKWQGLRLQAGINYEYLDARFRTIQPYRNMEFARDWNLQNIYSLQEEHFRGFYAGLAWHDSSLFRYQLQELRTGSQQGLRQQLSARHKVAQFDFSGQVDWMRNQANTFSGDYIRSKAGIRRLGRLLETGLTFEQENNRQNSLQGDSLSPNSFRFDILEFYFGNPKNKANQYQLAYTYRQDFLPFSSNLLATQAGHNYSLLTQLYANDNHQFKLSATYRELFLFETPQQNASKENNFLGQFEYNGRLLKDAINTQLFYSFSQGQELRRDIAFVEVPPGQGNYSWNDYNNNGVQELDEFEQAFFSDQANFIKIFIPGNTFVPTFGNRFNQTLNLQPARLMRNKKHVLARLSSLSSLAFEHKQQGKNGLEFLNPFQFNPFDTALVSSLASIRNTLFFDRNNPLFGIDLGYNRNLQKNLLSGGFETRQQIDQLLKIRVNILDNLNADATLTKGERTQQADLFFSRNYRIQQWELVPQLNWTATSQIRARLRYAYRDKQNTQIQVDPNFVPEVLKNQELTSEINLNFAGSSSLQFQFSWISNRFEGQVNSPAAFEMLQGLQAGNNQLWGIQLFHKLASQLQLNISYNGRKAEGSKTIHTGQMQARLVF